MTESTVRRRVSVTGTVQGVFFRDSLRQEAARHGVAGWARNCSDGSLEAVLEGDAEAVETVIAFCRHGPPRASVSGVSVSADDAPDGLSGFSIR